MKKQEEKKQVEKKQDDKPKKKKGLLLAGEILFWTVVSVFAIFFIWNGIDQNTGYKAPVFGLRTSVIVSPSMETAHEENTYLTDSMKRIKKYDVITTKVVSYDDIQLYDVVTYYSSNGLICHRVVDKYEDSGNQYLVTRGDANNINDTPISYSLVRGKVIGVTPGVGRVLLFIQSPYFLLGFFGSAFFILLGIYIFKGKSKKKEEQIPQKDNAVVANQAPAEEAKQEPVEEPKEEVVAKPVSSGLIELEPVHEDNNEPAQESSHEEEAKPSKPVTFEEAANEIWPQLNNPKPLPKEEKKAPVKKSAPKAAPKKEAAPKAEPKQAKEKAKPEKKPVKEQPKPAPKPEPKKEQKKPEPKADSKKDMTRVYHVNKRKEDGKWTVKFAGGEKVIKLFDTQKEALEYANQMAKNQDGTVLVHASKGANKGKIIKK